jgi:hypothetical protein
MPKPILIALFFLSFAPVPATAGGRAIVELYGASQCVRDKSRANDSYVRFRNGCNERVIMAYGNTPGSDNIGCRSNRSGSAMDCVTEINPGDTLIVDLRPGSDYVYKVCTSARWAAGECRVNNGKADRQAAAGARQRQQEQRQQQQTAPPPKSSGGGGAVLSGSALASRIGGQRFWVQPNDGSATFQARFVPGGEFVIGNNGQVTGSGRWWLSGGTLCTQLNGRVATICHAFTDLGGGKFRSNNGTVIWYR